MANLEPTHDGISECYWMTNFLVQVSCVSLWFNENTVLDGIYGEACSLTLLFLSMMTCRIDVFFGGGHLRIPDSGLVYLVWRASQCMSSCIALLSPEVRWSEMEWLVSLVKASRLSVRYDMNGLFYTFFFL